MSRVDAITSTAAVSTATLRYALGECPGYCCAVIRLPRDVIAGLRAGRFSDGDQVLAMLEPITQAEAREINRTLLRWPPDRAEPVAGDRYFTCRNWDAATGLCGIYDDRPAMCRAYPSSAPSGRCTHGCRCRA